MKSSLDAGGFPPTSSGRGFGGGTDAFPVLRVAGSGSMLTAVEESPRPRVGEKPAECAVRTAGDWKEEGFDFRR